MTEALRLWSVSESGEVESVSPLPQMSWRLKSY